MKIGFRRFAPGDEAAIARANERLRAAGLGHVIGCETRGGAEPSLHDDPISERLFVATDGEEIRGAVWLKEQRFWSREGAQRLGWMVFPVSESLFDRRFTGVPGTLLFGLLREQPRLMALGMGGSAGPFARLLAGAGWPSRSVPFWFRMVRPARCLRRLAALRGTRARRAACDALAFSGAGWLGHGLLRAARRVADHRSAGRYTATRMTRFDAAADALWMSSREHYGLVAFRDARALGALYPADFEPLTRLGVRDGSRALGWACTQSFSAAGTVFEKYFGDLQLGVITDCFAAPDDALDVFDAGVSRLLDEGVDLIVTNQGHPAWCAAARAAGFWRGPSNLAFAWSPALEKALPGAAADCFLTRSDCDGPFRFPQRTRT